MSRAQHAAEILVSSTWCKEMSALIIIGLAAALVAVGVVAAEAVHHVEVIRTESAGAITVFREVTSVYRLPAWCSRNLDLKQKQAYQWP